MRCVRLSVLVGFLCLFGVVACSDNPNQVKQVGGLQSTRVVAATGNLDQNIRGLLALFPKSLDERDADSEGPNLNPRATWDQITKKYATGLSKPAHMAIAQRKVLRLSEWVTRNAQMMSQPPGTETKAEAAARLVLYMNLYVFGGPGTDPGVDAAVGIVTPDAPASIVTPSTHAGVEFDAGSVDENTLVVVIQNPVRFEAECSGPLQTQLCQYPQFYTFDEYPHKTLLKLARFNVCHVKIGGTRNPGEIHDRLRLAHTKPANSADYTEGSTIRESNGENIEILPHPNLPSFSNCETSTYELPEEIGALGVFSRFARAIQKIVTPKTAYAIDLGLGGVSRTFSPFNDVDPLEAEVWHVVESGNFNGTWTRRGSSNVFDAVWTGPGPEPVTVTGVMTFSREGNSVQFQRTESSDENLCTYVGTLAEGGLSAEGTETCPNTETTFTWTASIGVQ